MTARDPFEIERSAEWHTVGKEASVESNLNQRVFRVCDVKLHAVQINDLIPIVTGWMKEKRAFHYITSTNANNVAIAMESTEYFEVIENADLSLPDGVPFLWYGRLKGFPLRKRCGIEVFMEAIFEMSYHGASYSHFFYGNTPEVLSNLNACLIQRYPDLVIAGMHSPPFRTLTPEEDAEDIRMINNSGADFLWVSLGCPRQERWLYDHRNALSIVAGGGAGGVFDIFSGDKPEAPAWVADLGLRWAFRLLLEPKRLFYRYCIRYPKFVFRFAWRSFCGD
jgi:N-acetylglucosaminyldiphosphoundecaprenol N-acetyl-beta-D-mannosaminyltransferase